MRHAFLCVISGLELSENLGRGDKIEDGLFITNDRSTIRRLLSNWGREYLGELMEHEVLSASAVVYSQSDIATDGASAAAFEYHEEVMATDIDFFLGTLWLIKDHCCSMDFILVLRGVDQMALRRPHSGVRFTANGDMTQTRFSRGELRQAREICRRFAKNGKEYSTGLTSLTKNASNSLSRAFSHRYAASQARDVAFKITSYCSALEALFLAAKGELGHQLAERVAFFLEDEPEERRRIFKQVKDAYNFRSSSVHGAGIKSREHEIKSITAACDSIVRRAFLKVIDSKDFHRIFVDENRLNEFFLNKIVGPKST